MAVETEGVSQNQDGPDSNPEPKVVQPQDISQRLTQLRRRTGIGASGTPLDSIRAGDIDDILRDLRNREKRKRLRNPAERL